MSQDMTMIMRRSSSKGSNRALGQLVVLSALACSSSKPEEPTARVADWSCAAGAVSESPLRRLTRFEYRNIVEDVLGIEMDFDQILPRDEVALGFDNQAGALTVSDLHVEAYSKAANLVAESAVAAPKKLQELAGCDTSDADCAGRVASELARRLLRRPLSAEQRERLITLFDDDYSEAGFREGTYRILASLLQSPDFLYRLERSTVKPKAEGELTLAPSVLAARLAFLYWGSAPDDALIEAADGDRLRTLEDLDYQSRRLLEDERARRGVLHFFEQWLDLQDFERVEKDQRLLADWNEDVRADLARETRGFLSAILWDGDARFETLLSARYSYVSPLLMDFYGLPITSTEPNQFSRVDFEQDQPRFGVLTQGSILSHLAGSDQTSPILRGKFVRERFFCTTPPPPPPNIVVTAPSLDPRKTTRERFEQHRSDPVCASCHQLLDPIGLAFEHYNAAGQYRREENGFEIDASGELIDTDVDGPVSGVEELATKLTESDEVRRCMVTQLFRYAFGRGETAEDACTLDKLEQQFLATNGDYRELLVALSQTEPFTEPAPAPAADEEDP